MEEHVDARLNVDLVGATTPSAPLLTIVEPSTAHAVGLQPVVG